MAWRRPEFAAERLQACHAYKKGGILADAALCFASFLKKGDLGSGIWCFSRMLCALFRAIWSVFYPIVLRGNLFCPKVYFILSMLLLRDDRLSYPPDREGKGRTTDLSVHVPQTGAHPGFLIIGSNEKTWRLKYHLYHSPAQAGAFFAFFMNFRCSCCFTSPHGPCRKPPKPSCAQKKSNTFPRCCSLSRASLQRGYLRFHVFLIPCSSFPERSIGDGYEGDPFTPSFGHFYCLFGQYSLPLNKSGGACLIK